MWDLVDRGLITAGDVVYVMTTLGHTFEELVDVAGIPEAELVLSGALLAAGHAVLRRRQS